MLDREQAEQSDRWQAKRIPILTKKVARIRQITEKRQSPRLLV